MHLLQHGTDEVGGLEELQVDVHVEGHLPPPLQLLLLRRLVLVPVKVFCPNETVSPSGAYTSPKGVNTDLQLSAAICSRVYRRLRQVAALTVS